MKILSITLAFSSLLAGQTITAVRNIPESAPDATGGPKKHTAVSVPAVGYMLAPGGAAVEVIAGAANRFRVSESVPVPADAAHVYLSPRQRYALIESGSEQPLAVWELRNMIGQDSASERKPIAGANSHPDLAVFSPDGEAALLYSRNAARLQVIQNLPANPSVGREFSATELGDFSKILITDDGQMVAAEAGNGSLVYSSGGGPWQTMRTSYSPRAWSFIPGTHDLVINDSNQSALVLLPRITEGSGSVRILGSQSIQANYLAFSKDGKQLLAASNGAGGVWVIDLNSGSALPMQTTTSVQLLAPLWDGRSFLISSSPLGIIRPALVGQQ